MRTTEGASPIVMRVPAFLLTATVACVVGFIVGRVSAPNLDPAFVAPAPPFTADPSAPGLALPRLSLSAAMEPRDARAELLRAMQQPATERSRAVRVALIAWLAAGGAQALAAVRNDPELAPVAGQMIRIALYAYPEVFLDDPSLLEDVPDAEQLITTAAIAVAAFDPDVARALVEEHLSGSRHGDELLMAIGQVDPVRSRALPVEDVRSELESLLAAGDPMQHLPRVHHLLSLVAADDPAAAAALMEDLPGRSASFAIGPLIETWSRSDPEEAARWLASRGAPFYRHELGRLAELWGERDFNAASLFAESLTGARRAEFLSGMASAVARKSRDDALAWLSRYEGEPAYPQLVANAAGQLAHKDFDAALTLIETLPAKERPNAYTAVLPRLAFQDPEAAINRIVELEDESMRNLLLPMATSLWGQLDVDSALDWALDLQPGSTRDTAIASVVAPLMRYDTDQAMDAIEQIDDPKERRASVQQLLLTVESDEAAILIGRDHGFDRDAVLELRESHIGTLGPVTYRRPPRSIFIGANSGTAEPK